MSEGGQCSAEHERHGEIHYCIREGGHTGPHWCDFGHNWLTAAPPGRGEDVAVEDEA